MDLLRSTIDLTAPEFLADRPATPAEETVDVRAEKERKRKIVEEGLERYKIAQAAYSDQVREELADLEFEGGDQWDPQLRKSREGGIAADGRTVPPKPCLQFNKLDPTIQQILTEARDARFSIQIKPKAGQSTQDVAEVRQGLIRSIEVESNAAAARMWAFDRAVKCGRGAYRILKVAANDGDFDLDLVVKRILNQHSAWFDPFAQEPDWSDGEWCLITSDLPETEFKRRYPKSELSVSDTEQLKSIGDAAPGWVGGDTEGTRTFRVAEYFYVEHESRTLVHVRGQGTFWLDTLSADSQTTVLSLPKTQVKRRDVDIRKVKWCVITAADVLDEEDWEGRYIPVIPVIGKEYNIGGKRRWKGIVNNSKDAQRSYNYMRSKQIEAIGLSSLAPWVMAEGQDANYEHMWDQANTTAYTRLIYTPKMFDGELAPPPHRDVAEPPVQAITLAAHEADGDIKATMGRYDPSLGRPGAERSGKAIKELKMQGETGTSNYTENFALALTYEGKVLNDMLKYVYDTPGRIVKIIGEEEEEKEVMLNQPYSDEQGTMQKILPEQFIEGKHKEFDLSEGEFSVVVTVGKSFQTRREEAAGAMTELAQAAPQLVPGFADLWVSYMDFPGAEAISKRLKAMNPIAKDDDEGGKPPLTPEAQAQLQQMAQQLQMATQAAQEFKQKLDSDAPRWEAQVKMKAAELLSRERIAEITAQKDLAIAQATLDLKNSHAILQAQIDARAQQDDQAHEMEMLALEQQHEHTQNTLEQQASFAQTGMNQAHEQDQNALDRQHEHTSTLLNAAIQPAPAPPVPSVPHPLPAGPINVGGDE